MAHSDLMQFFLIGTPIALTWAVGIFFWILSRRVKNANRNAYLRHQALTGTAVNAVTGSVGCDLPDGVTPEIDRGFCSIETEGTVFLARQGKLPRDTITNMF